ncbi:aconitate hydratase [Candidatus Margulisiibacteriota bacterium]
MNQPLTLTEKNLYAHLYGDKQQAFKRGKDYVNFLPDRVAMQDATAQMALLQFMQAGKNRVAIPASVHCDHLIHAECGAEKDLVHAKSENKEVYDFLGSVSKKYGIDFWQPGAGIIHQIVFENYAFPGGMMIGTDSHTPTAGGLGMIAIGVGGADAVDVLVGMPWELKFPQIMGIKLTGRLSGWTSPKDVALYLLDKLTVKGGTGYVLEYFGEGIKSISATGRATICNMGAELGATCSIFPYDDNTKIYLEATNRKEIAEKCEKNIKQLQADPEVYQNPGKYYDKVIEIDLNKLEPYINGPFSPDKAYPISKFAKAVVQEGYPEKLSVGLIGSCTNSSYEDLSKCASISRQIKEKKLNIKAEFLISPGSDKVYETIKKDGILSDFEAMKASVLANACGPCIGQWARIGAEKQEKNSIIHSFNRNFAKRADGNPNTYAFVASPEIVTALTIAGSLKFNPLTDKLKNKDGEEVLLDIPKGVTLPKNGFINKSDGLILPAENGLDIIVEIDEKSERLAVLAGFPKWQGYDFADLCLLIKVKGKCTTDHISMAGPWLKYRGHLDNISDNLLIGAVNSFNAKVNSVKNLLTGQYDAVPKCARYYQANAKSSVIIGEENYGEGSSREHAAMEPRHLGVKAVIVKSFARIHETNLKKQGILALTFADKNDYGKIAEDDRFDLIGLKEFTPGKELTLIARHKNGSEDKMRLNHTYSLLQIEWFKFGSALNYLKKKR